MESKEQEKIKEFMNTLEEARRCSTPLSGNKLDLDTIIGNQQVEKNGKPKFNVTGAGRVSLRGNELVNEENVIVIEAKGRENEKENGQVK